ncbi:MAG: hypothetical protein OXG37_15065 [Actinomycetia bacterium]|nr:hypothetical protein [Actinomycetes bacterium]
MPTAIARELVHFGSTPIYAGYMAWRGVYSESRITDHGPIEEAYASESWFTVCLDGGHGAIYLIPGFDGSLKSHQRQLNWLIYYDPPAGVHFEEPESVPPGAVSSDLGQALDDLLDLLPPYFASLLRLTEPEEISIQPIYDQPLPTYVRCPVLLIGDASTISRPPHRQRRDEGAPGRARARARLHEPHDLERGAGRLQRGALGSRQRPSRARALHRARLGRGDTPLPVNEPSGLRRVGAPDALGGAAVPLPQPLAGQVGGRRAAGATRWRPRRVSAQAGGRPGRVGLPERRGRDLSPWPPGYEPAHPRCCQA